MLQKLVAQMRESKRLRRFVKLLFSFVFVVLFFFAVSFSASGITKFIIDHSGNVGVSTTTPSYGLDVIGVSTTTPSYGLDVNGTARITGNFSLGSNPSWSIDNSDGLVSILNLRARGAADSKALMRLMPQGNPSGDKSEFTLMGTDVDLTNRWWTDFKVSEQSSTLRRLHILTDNNGTEEPITRVAFEIDGSNKSSSLEEFSVVRNGWVGNTENGIGNGSFMFRIVGGTGITAFEQGTIQLATGNLVLGSDTGDVVASPVIGGALRPYSDNTVNLGQTSFRWKSLRIGTDDSSFAGNVGIETTSPGAKLEINGGARLNTTKAKPTCGSTQRGTFWVTQGAAGVKDNVEVCAKDAADAYAWRTLY